MDYVINSDNDLKKALAEIRPIRDTHLGELLIEEGELTEKQLAAALDYQREHIGLHLGEVLLALGFCTKEQVNAALAAKLGFPSVILAICSRMASWWRSSSSIRKVNIWRLPIEANPVPVKYTVGRVRIFLDFKNHVAGADSADARAWLIAETANGEVEGELGAGQSTTLYVAVNRADSELTPDTYRGSISIDSNLTKTSLSARVSIS